MNEMAYRANFWIQTFESLMGLGTTLAVVAVVFNQTDELGGWRAPELSFWFIRIEHILMIFWSMYTAGRWPVGIYPPWLRWMLTLVVPIAFAVTVPAEAISGRVDASSLVGALALAAVLLTFSRWFWNRGLQHYSGASA